MLAFYEYIIFNNYDVVVTLSFNAKMDLADFGVYM